MTEVYTDGSCDNSKNRKRVGVREGGWGAVVIRPDGSKIELSVGTYFNTTSARMELHPVVAVIALLKGYGINLTIWTDNMNIRDTFNLDWVFNWERQNWAGSESNGERKSSDLWKKFLSHYRTLQENGGSLTINWVKGHDDHPDNERADQLAKEARSSKKDMIDDQQSW